MPNTSTQTINDGTADIVFSPDSVTGTHVLFTNQEAASLETRELLHFDRPANGNTLRRSLRINVPLPRETEGGTVVEMCSCKVDVVFPPSSSKAERTRLVTLLQNAVQLDAFEAVSENPEWFW